MRGRVLIIAGSDPSGGAGIQADVKTVTALGGFAMTAITALTVQNTRGVSAVHPVSSDIVRDQAMACVEDIGVDAVKIGMIADAKTARAVAALLEGPLAGVPAVIDPVLTATSGDALAGDGVAGAILDALAPRARLLTPNVPELAALTGRAVAGVDDAVDAARALLRCAGARAVLAKGGHFDAEEVVDALVADEGDATLFSNRGLASTATHGTGCTLASAIATGLAQGRALDAACTRAIAYVREAIRTAPGYGAGRGPLNHAHTVRIDEEEG
ncbi:MAG: bifunctional hydroxymethylpyrimidine kinase/phosphomethylpyrimidine kinase [Parvularculaceae bacterium]